MLADGTSPIGVTAHLGRDFGIPRAKVTVGVDNGVVVGAKSDAGTEVDLSTDGDGIARAQLLVGSRPGTMMVYARAESGGASYSSSVVIPLVSGAVSALDLGAGDTTPVTIGQARTAQVIGYANAERTELARGAAVYLCASPEDTVLPSPVLFTDGQGKSTFSITAGPKAREQDQLVVTACPTRDVCNPQGAGCGSITFAVSPVPSVVERLTVGFARSVAQVREDADLVVHAYSNGAFTENAASAAVVLCTDSASLVTGTDVLVTDAQGVGKSTFRLLRAGTLCAIACPAELGCPAAGATLPARCASGCLLVEETPKVARVVLTSGTTAFHVGETAKLAAYAFLDSAMTQQAGNGLGVQLCYDQASFDSAAEIQFTSNGQAAFQINPRIAGRFSVSGCPTDIGCSLDPTRCGKLEFSVAAAADAGADAEVNN